MKTLLSVVRLIIFLKGLNGRKQAVLSAAVLVAVFVVPTVVFATREPGQPPRSSDETVAYVKEAAGTNAAPKVSQQQSIKNQVVEPAQSSSSQPSATEENTNSQPQTANTGDLRKQHPTPGTPKRPPSADQLSVSQSTFTIRAGETIHNAFTAKAPSGETISPVNIAHAESNPATDNALSLSHDDGFPTPLYISARHVNLIASAGVAPGTYKVVVKATSDPYMNDNVIFYATTLTVTILP